MDNEDLINFLKTKYKVKRTKDGTYVVKTLEGTFTIKEDKNYMFESDESPNRLGRDDIMPNFDNRITREPGFRGAIPTFQDLEDMTGESLSKDSETGEDNPFAKYDPIYPHRKGNKKGNEPDNDNERFYGPKDGFWYWGLAIGKYFWT